MATVGNKKFIPKKGKTMPVAIGDTGTERYGGYFSEEFNQEWRDETRILNVEKMRRGDGRVKQLLNALKAPMLSTEWRIQEAEDTPEAMEQKEFVQQDLFNGMQRSWKDFLHESLTYFEFGFSVFEQIWGHQPFDDKLHLIDLEPRIQDSIQNWPMMSGERTIVQNIYTDEFKGKTVDVKIPFHKLLVLTNDKEGDDVTGQSVLRAAWKHYWYKTNLENVAGISAERFGVGIPTITLPPGSGDTEKAAAEEMVKRVKANEKVYLVLPNADWNFEVKVPSGNPQAQQIENLIKYHDVMILSSGLAAFLNLGTDKVGSFALVRDLQGFFLKYIEDKARYWAEQIDKQVIERMIDMNFGPQEVYPKLKFEPLGDIDFKEMAEVQKLLVDAGLVRINPKIKQFNHSLFNLPEISDKEVKEMEKEAEEKKVKREEKEEEQKNMPPIPGIPGQPPQPPIPGQPLVSPIPPKPEEKEEDEKKEKQKHECPHETLAQKKSLKFWRDLTLQEKRTNFRFLNDSFNELEGGLELDLIDQIKSDLDKTIKRVESKVKNNDLAGIAAMSFVSQSQIRKILNEFIKQAFEVGKKTSSGELKVDKPATPTKQTQLMNFEASELANNITNELDRIGKNTAKEGINKNATPQDTASATSSKVRNIASGLIVGAVGVLIGENVNKGRRFVFDKNKSGIKAFQRSEILDERTCDMCMSLDQRIVKSDDPFAQLDLVHSYCRGVWIPILSDEDIEGTVGLPKTVREGFDTVGGAPSVNNFDQLKKPINRANPEVQQEIKRREK